MPGVRTTCPSLSYRREDGDHGFETDRAYCEAAATFVQPMRADICNDRHSLNHTTDCDLYPEAENE